MSTGLPLRCTSANFTSRKPILATGTPTVLLRLPAKRTNIMMTSLEIDGTTSTPVTIIICWLQNGRRWKCYRRRRGQNRSVCRLRCITTQPLPRTRSFAIILAFMTPYIVWLATLLIRGPRTTSWSCCCWSRDGWRCWRCWRCWHWGGWCSRATWQNCDLSAVPELLRFTSTDGSSRIQRIRACKAITPLCVVIWIIFISWRPTIIRSNISPLHHYFITGHSYWQLELHGEIDISASEMTTIWVIRVLRCSIRYILDEFKRMLLKTFLCTIISIGTDHNILVAPMRSV